MVREPGVGFRLIIYYSARVKKRTNANECNSEERQVSAKREKDKEDKYDGKKWMDDSVDWDGGWRVKNGERERDDQANKRAMNILWIFSSKCKTVFRYPGTRYHIKTYKSLGSSRSRSR